MAVARISLDQYPVIANLPSGGKYEPSRVVIVNDRIQVWVIRGTGTSAPEVAFEADALSVEGNRIAGYSILTPDGMVVLAQARGCGCGSALKTFDPYAGATRVAVASA